MLFVIPEAEDREKFEDLYRTYRQLLFYVANQILRDEYQAEDAVHQAFVKILENLDKIRLVDCPQTKGYVVVIVRNLCFNLLKSKKRRGDSSLEELEESFQPPAPEQVEDAAEQRDGYRALVEGIKRLPPNYAAVLLLKYDGGYSTEEIAKQLDLTTENVKKLLQRARKKLEEKLEKEATV